MEEDRGGVAGGCLGDSVRLLFSISDNCCCCCCCSLCCCLVNLWLSLRIFSTLPFALIRSSTSPPLPPAPPPPPPRDEAEEAAAQVSLPAAAAVEEEEEDIFFLRLTFCSFSRFCCFSRLEEEMMISPPLVEPSFVGTGRINLLLGETSADK